MDGKIMTRYFILVVVMVVVGWDVFILNHSGSEATVSGVVRTWAERWPLLPPLTAFAMGMLYWHFFC